jgi:hypothetical protein
MVEKTFRIYNNFKIKHKSFYLFYFIFFLVIRFTIDRIFISLLRFYNIYTKDNTLFTKLFILLAIGLYYYFKERIKKFKRRRLSNVFLNVSTFIFSLFFFLTAIF